MNDVIEAIKKAENIVVLTHENPDGDAIGSSLSFYNCLKTIKNIDVIIPEYSKIFNYLPGSDNILSETNKEYDLAIAVDCGSKNRIKDPNNVFDKCKENIVIDHHSSNNGYGKINFIDPNCSSCCQMIFELLQNMGFDIDKNIGTCIMTGIITDTGGFLHSDVDKKTFDIASFLYSKGVDISTIYTNIMKKKSKSQIELYKLVLNRLEFYANGKIAFSYISNEDITNTLASYGDHEGLVEIGKDIKGVEVSIFVREEDSFKVSLRSNGLVDVSKIAEKFGGGGHFCAAGCQMEEDFNKIKEKLINTTKEFL